MNKEKGNVLLLLLISVLLVAAVASYFYSQGTKEGQQQQKTIKFAATEEAKDLITLDKAAHNWMNLWTDGTETKRNYERLVEYDKRYEIPIDEMIEAGLLTKSFAKRFGGEPVSVYGIPYTSSVIKRAVGLGTDRTCISGGPDKDPVDECKSNTGGVCTPYLYTTGRCLIEETEDGFSILTTLGTKGEGPTVVPEMTCPFYTEYERGRGHFLAINAPAFNSFELSGSCYDHYSNLTVASAGRDYLLNAVNIENTAVLQGTHYTYIDIDSYGSVTQRLECELKTSGHDFNNVQAMVSPRTMDSFVYCEIKAYTASSCNVRVSYCENGVTSAGNFNVGSGQCTSMRVSNAEDGLNNGTGYMPFGGYNVDAPWSCSVTGAYQIGCSGEYQCSGPPEPGGCPAYLNYTKDGTLMIDKDHFKTYPSACSTPLANQAAGEVAGHYSTYNPPLKWDNGPVCGVVINGSESGDPAIICSGSENDGGGTGNIACEIYKYDTEGDGPGFIHDYPGQSCYD